MAHHGKAPGGPGADGSAPSAVEDMTPEARNVEFINACKTGKYGLCKVMLASSLASVRARDATGWSPLLWSSFNGHHRVVELLLDHGAADDWRDENNIEDMLEATQATEEDGPAAQAPTGAAAHRKPLNSPLHWAVYRGHLRVVWILLRAGFSSSDVDDRGNTALHLAAMNGNIDVVRSIMMSGVQVRQLNLDGNDPLAVASSADARALLRKAAEQRVCPGSKLEFGPRQPQFLCFSTGLFYSDEASNQIQVPAFADTPGVMRPVRVSNEREYEIRDAQAALVAALNPSGRLSLEEIMGASPDDDDFTLGEGVTGIDATNAGLAESGEAAAGLSRGAASSPPSAPGAGGFPPAPGVGSGVSGAPGGASAGTGTGSGAMRKGLNLGVASIVEEGEEDEEEEDEDEDEEHGGGSGVGGGGAGRDVDDAAVGLTSPGGSIGGGSDEDDDGTERKRDSVAVRAAKYDAEPEGSEFPRDRDEHLEADDIPALRKAMSAASQLSASVWLVARAERALKRVTAWAEAEREARLVASRRPVGRAAETKPLRQAIARATALGVDDRITALGDVARTAEAESRVRDVVRVCSTIPLATHDEDADLARLAACIDELRALDPGSSVLPAASDLLVRLGIEVELSDAVLALDATLADTEKTFAECREDDPTELPLPEPTPEELEAKAKAEAEAAAAKAAAAAKPKPRGGRAAAAEPEPEEEPLPPLYPSPQLQALTKVQESTKQVALAIERATEAGADAELIEATAGKVKDVEARREALWEDEIARIRVFEAERIKREKKKKKGKKKKKKA
ncbi:hypothetical protein FNF29_01405 [Cafeteria roenbergensis]|uniref:Uncharacterized protein n=1 Tax=Cafeteria roenbergensis TaxID=33653 RepID=A0A5A8CSE8_CAFRO|nr:hypothetical protein FNF29_01405 [Cafeteria roenbergensis]KAA0163619.1 hypothetical protein FNF31_02780 [Cafeteria roenbergensis]KAA0171805.1 hypothetical protein FNF28_00441 [Cafeteria roenbergensis]|eukprot:KAA0155986.1 hypothetical protein FNF29_01405 [Cafeteria roenbergensis]